MIANRSYSHRHIARARTVASGFTLIELLVVIAIIAILAAMLLPALALAKKKAQMTTCINDEKQLVLIWKMYNTDNNDRVVGSTCGKTSDWRISPAGAGFTMPRVPITMTPDLINKFLDEQGFEQGGLFPYAKNPDLIHCPGDTRYQTGNWAFDSFSMENGLNGDTTGTGGTPNNILKESTIRHPSDVWIWTEENDPRKQTAGAYTVYENQDSWELVTSGSWPPPTWYDGPACFHGNGAVFNYADGHAAFNKWYDSATIALGLNLNGTRPASCQATTLAMSPHDLAFVAAGYVFQGNNQ